MAKLELKIAEAYNDGDEVVYVIEFFKKGNGVQRPTFRYPKGTPLAEASKDMRKQIEAQERLNARPRKKPQLSHVGKKI